MSAQKNSAASKIHEAEKRWHNTIGEKLLRFGAVFLALSIIIIGVHYNYNETYGYRGALFSSAVGADNAIKYEIDRINKTVLFVSLNSDAYYKTETKIIKEAIASYHGVRIHHLKENDISDELLKEGAVVFVLGSAKINNLDGLQKLLKKIAEKNIPLYWLGSGFSLAANIFNIPFTQNERLDDAFLPPKSRLLYKGAEISAEGIPYTRGNLTSFSSLGEVIAKVSLHDSFSRAAIIKYGNIIYSAFNPFSRSGKAPFALSVTMDSLSHFVGEHKTKPRIVFRLEDINGVSHNHDDTSFNKTVDYLMEQDVYIHLGIIPTMVDDKGNVVANIGNASPVLEFVMRNPSHVGIVQHGYKHWRNDPRNKGMGSGDASEFFIDDDQTMGKKAAEKFAREVIKNGCAVMLENKLIPTMFEAPHYEISPSQQQVAEKMYSLMQHPPLFYHREGPYGFLLPWLTQRNKSVYVSSVSDYVDITQPDSIKKILNTLETAARILPDPVVNVFFHPYIMDVKEQSGALKELIEGIKGLDYQFVNMLDEVEPVSTPQCM